MSNIKPVLLVSADLLLLPASFLKHQRCRSMIAHLEKAFAALEPRNKLTVEDLHGGKPWVTDHHHWNFEAAKRATKVHLATC
jgi:hypothetical protein